MQVVKPHQIRHHYIQSLIASPDRVFPLLCPVREVDWAPGWAPRLVVSESGVMEERCLFVTPEDENAEAIWIATRHDPRALSLELWRIIPDHTASRFEIELTPAPDGHTAASITYACTSLGPAGDRFLDSCTVDWYEGVMRHWEQSLNYYLEHGKMIPAPVN